MVMADRADVRTASAPIAVVDTVGLAQQMVNALIRVPFRRPWQGSASVAHNLGQTVTREVVRTFMGYSSSLPIDEFRSLEALLDRLSDVALAPVVAFRRVQAEATAVGGVPGIWYRPSRRPSMGRILYLHGGGYVGTSPHMYAAFAAQLAAVTRCDIFVADYRLAPEFPFPAGLDDAIAVLEAWAVEAHDGVGSAEGSAIFIAGDSGGGGLATSVAARLAAGAAARSAPSARRRSRHSVPAVAGMILFSPEVDLSLDEPSVTENADSDILPWNIPTAPYLHGTHADDGAVSAIDVDVSGWPPVYVCWGGDEMFRDPIRLFVRHLGSASVPTTAQEFDGMFHVFPILMPWAESSKRVFASVERFVRARVDTDDAATDGPAGQRRTRAARSTSARSASAQSTTVPG